VGSKGSEQASGKQATSNVASLPNKLRKEVMITMIELFLSSDGKHTVHVSADTPEQLAELAPKAKALFEKVLEKFGTKAEMWEAVINRRGNREAKEGKRIDTVEQARQAVAPKCPMHQTAMVYRQGRFGAFWSCPVKKPDGRWCQVTKEVSESREG